MSEMQEVSTVAKKKLSEYIENLESHFVEDSFSAAESRAIMEDCLHEW
jgi:kinesin family protein 11